MIPRAADAPGANRHSSSASVVRNGRIDGERGTGPPSCEPVRSWPGRELADEYPMIAARMVVAAFLIGGVVQAQGGRGQTPAPAPASVPEQPSPLGFDGLLSYMQAFPGDPNSLPVRQASSAKYWVFQGIGLRAPGQGQAAAWTSFGPQTDLQTTEAFV